MQARSIGLADSPLSIAARREFPDSDVVVSARGLAITTQIVAMQARLDCAVDDHCATFAVVSYCRLIPAASMIGPHFL